MSLINIFSAEGEALTENDLQKAFSNIELYTNGFFIYDCTKEELNKLTGSLKSFSEMNYGECSDDDILDGFIKALQINHVFAYTPQPYYLTKDELLFRVRSASYSKLPYEKFRNEADCWNPPKDKATQGRLNKLHESMLYTTLGNPLICMDECHIEIGNQFMLMVYSVLDEIEFSLIGGRLHPELEKKLTPNSLRYHQICTLFLNDFFSRPVDECNKEYYRVTDLLANRIFTNKEVGQRAWGYATVAGEDKRGFINLCIDPAIAKAHLQLKGVILGTRLSKNAIKIDGIVESFDRDNGSPVYNKCISCTNLYHLLCQAKGKYALDFECTID